MITLKNRLEQQRKAVKDFESALEDIKNPPKYPGPSSEPLTFLQQQVAQAQNEADRALKITEAQTALKLGQQALLELEREWIDAEAEADAVLAEMSDLAAQITLLGDAMIEKATRLQALYRDKLPALHKVHGQDKQFLMNGRLLAQIPVAVVHPTRLVEILPGSERDRRVAESAFRAQVTAQREAAALD